MAFVSGHGGSFTGTTKPAFYAAVRNWTLESTATLHDSTVMGNGVAMRSRILGLADWSATLEYFTDNAVEIDSIAVGGAVAALLFSIDGSDTYPRWEASVGIIESHTSTCDTNGVVSGTMVIKANGGTLAYEVSA